MFLFPVFAGDGLYIIAHILKGDDSLSLDEKIGRAEAAVLTAKARYDKALDELEKLVAKRKQLEDKRVLEAYHESDKPADEIIAFLLPKNGENP